MSLVSFLCISSNGPCHKLSLGKKLGINFKEKEKKKKLPM